MTIIIIIIFTSLGVVGLNGLQHKSCIRKLPRPACPLPNLKVYTGLTLVSEFHT